MKLFIQTWGFIILSALLDSYAGTVIKSRFNQLGVPDFSSFSGFSHFILNFFSHPLLVSAIIAFLTAPVFWFLALSRTDITWGYPVLVASHLVFILFFGIFFLSEAITLNKIIGLILITASLFFFYKA